MKTNFAIWKPLRKLKQTVRYKQYSFSLKATITIPSWKPTSSPTTLTPLPYTPTLGFQPLPITPTNHHSPFPKSYHHVIKPAPSSQTKPKHSIPIFNLHNFQ